MPWTWPSAYISLADDAYLTVKQAAEKYPALGERFLRRLVAERRLTYYKVGSRVLFAESDILDLIERGRVSPRKRR